MVRTEGELGMQSTHQAHLAFHLTGKRLLGALDAIDGLALRPALLAGYRDLTKLRYDFPLVLVCGDMSEDSVHSLSGLFDAARRQIADGVEGEGLKKQALRLEREIRMLAAECDGRLLSEVCDAALTRLSAEFDEVVRDNLKRLLAGLAVDGVIVDYNGAMPSRLCRHLWQAVQEKKARVFREHIAKLITKLSDILAADVARSDQGRAPERLKASVGATHQEAFDFAAMSRLLADACPHTPLSASRRRRIEGLLSVLTSQQFFPIGTAAAETVELRRFVFDKCADAVAAYRRRLPEVVELAKAIAMAERDIEGEYNEAKHDVIFAELAIDGLDPGDLDLFPDYLVCVRASDMTAEDHDRILDALAAGMRAKVLVETDDILEPSPIASGTFAFNWRGRQLANAAMGLNTLYVLQSGSSQLFQLRQRVFRGMAYSGPAVFSVFSGGTATNPDLSPYLTAAAAVESRAFPVFTYDPSAGPDWASRFQLDGNPQAERDWPVRGLAYEDEGHQRISERLEFTLIDFVACDPRYAKHFARVPRLNWTDKLVPLSEFLGPEPTGPAEQVPCLLMTDRNNLLQKVIVDEKLVREARRCAEAWRSLQELGGIHNSHAARLLAQQQKDRVEQSPQQPAPNDDGSNPTEIAPAAVSAAPATAPEQAEAAKPSDAPYIETLRCTTCNECTQINDKMFAYNENRQAFIANPDAGTYRQLVEAAESCQVAIIHPGKPRNPNEPGLDDLLRRAEAFL